MIERRLFRFEKNGKSFLQTLYDCMRNVFLSPIFIDKNRIFLDHLIDQNDGSYFELKDRYLCKTDLNQAKELIQTGEEASGDNAGQDNRDLCDEGSANQTLQHDEIEQLKSEGA